MSRLETAVESNSKLITGGPGPQDVANSPPPSDSDVYKLHPSDEARNPVCDAHNRARHLARAKSRLRLRELFISAIAPNTLRSVTARNPAHNSLTLNPAVIGQQSREVSLKTTGMHLWSNPSDRSFSFHLHEFVLF